MNLNRLAAASTAALLLTLAACAGALDEQTAHAAPPFGTWPPVWQDLPEPPQSDFTMPSFERPTASQCHRAPTTREVPGGGREQQELSSSRGRRGDAESVPREQIGRAHV